MEGCVWMQMSSSNEIYDRKIIIDGEGIGVAYKSGPQNDDFKSYVYRLFNLDRRISKGNRIFWPFRNLQFKGYRGEILGIIGSNGSGKTTLCKTISGILQPDEGHLKVKGNVTALFSLGLGFNRELTGRENVYMNAILRGIPKKKISDYMDHIHEFSGLGKFMDLPIKTYSSGMLARLGFSIVSWTEPEILIIDEALNTGDLAFGQRAAERMKELVAKAKMVILVTHNIDFAVKTSDRLIWMDKGEIKAEGDPSSVAKLYKESMPKKSNQVKRVLKLNSIQSRITDRVVVDAQNISITFKYRGSVHKALNNVSFRIREGEVVGIIGHNGAGKSTLCKVITRILAPDSGKLEINGETTALLNYGIGFNQQLTGKDNILLNGMLLGIPKSKIEEHTDQIIQFSGLEKHIDKPVKQYSAGMKSRLGFSIAATLEPDIFIIDESLSTGDMEFNQKASLKIQELIDQAKAVIVVTHNMGFVETVCTRAIWLKNGEIQFDGDPVEAVRRYKRDAVGAKADKGVRQ
jgi:teichoic acid transport system ATP-binding protein